jgi:hypothetical protein
MVAACPAPARPGIGRDQHRDRRIARVGVVGPKRAAERSSSAGRVRYSSRILIMASDGLRPFQAADSMPNRSGLPTRERAMMRLYQS